MRCDVYSLVQPKIRPYLDWLAGMSSALAEPASDPLPQAVDDGAPTERNRHSVVACSLVDPFGDQLHLPRRQLSGIGRCDLALVARLLELFAHLRHGD